MSAPSKAVEEAIKSGAPNVDTSNLPDVSDITPETITENVRKINANCPNPRLKFLLSNLVGHLHDFVRETDLTTEEWMQSIQFLTATGKKSTDIRQEFILLSDVLGVSALVDALDHPRVGNSTENTVLGPFFTEDAHDISHGESIASEGKGEYMYVSGNVKAVDGTSVAGAIVDTWETDDQGFYDTQYDGRTEPDCRGRLKTGDKGEYAFRAVVPVAYPVPKDGPVGELMGKMGRHVFRPAHLHVKIQAEGYETLVTTLFPRGDPYLTSDAVFGVKKSLIADLGEVIGEEETRKKGFKKGDRFKTLEWDFVLVKSEDANAARAERMKAKAKTADI